MIVAAHQPNHLPWLGFFHKLAHCDRFVILDHVQFEKQNYQNRTRVKLASGAAWMIVPLVRDGHEQPICDKRMPVESGTHDWRRRVWRTLEHAYRRAPHFLRYADALACLYDTRWERLVDLNVALIEQCLVWLGLERPLLRSSALGLSGKKSEMIAELCEKAGGDVYLSGAGGSRGYLDCEHLASRGVRVVWQSFAHPVYPQLHPAHGFLPNLSVIDLLFNCGPRSREILLGAAPAPRAAAG